VKPRAWLPVFPHAFPVDVDEGMQIQIASGAALISYFVVALERKMKRGSILMAAVMVLTIIMALKYSEWKSIQTIFAVAATMNPLSVRLANYLSPMPVSVA